jgi:hypothetical protein
MEQIVVGPRVKEEMALGGWVTLSGGLRRRWCTRSSSSLAASRGSLQRRSRTVASSIRGRADGDGEGEMGNGGRENIFA